MNHTVKLIKGRPGGSHYYEVNGKQVEVYWNSRTIEELVQLVTSLHQVLTDFDIPSFRNLNEKYQDATIFGLSCFAFTIEFEAFIKAVGEVLFEQGISISNRSVYNFLRSGDANENRTYAHSKSQQMFSQAVETYLTELRERLKIAIFNKDKFSVWKLCKGLYMRTTEKELCEFCLTNCGEDFSDYVRLCAEDFLKKQKPIGWLSLYNYSFYGEMETNVLANRATDLLEKYDGNVFKQIAKEIHYAQMEDSKKWRYRFEDDIWILYRTHLETIHRKELDFAELPDAIKYEVKLYVESLIQRNEMHRKISIRLNDIRRGIRCLMETYKDDIESVLDIDYFQVQHMFDDLLHMEDEDGKPFYQLSTIRGTITEMKLLFDWLLRKFKKENDIINPFRKFKVYNAEAYVTKTKYIPEVVVEGLQSNLMELPEPVKNAWMIMMHTGMRISDCLALEEGCLFYDKADQMMKLKYIPIKIRKYRERLGLPEYHTIPAKPILIQYVLNQIQLTSALRRDTNFKYIFITRNLHNQRITLQSKEWMAEQINNLIKKYDIRDDFGNLHHYTHHQCRKTVTTELISNGATLEQVADLINHLNLRTTFRDYSDVQNEKLAPLESKFYEIAIERVFDKETIKFFSDEEKQALITEIKLGSRETPEGHGVCLKHVSFGACAKMQCLGCRFLTTGPQYLKRLRKVESEQRAYIQEIEDYYQQQNIEDFNEYREYQMQIDRLEVIVQTIEETIQTCIEAGIDYEGA